MPQAYAGTSSEVDPDYLEHARREAQDENVGSNRPNNLGGVNGYDSGMFQHFDVTAGQLASYATIG